MQLGKNSGVWAPHEAQQGQVRSPPVLMPRNVLALDPKFSVENYLQTLHYQFDSGRQHPRDPLLKAALPA